MTYQQAVATLPADAKWSSSFGYPGQGGYSEYHRTPDGQRFEIANGTYLDFEPFTWTVKVA